jgi:ABC-type uncharacterized transport system involved in gliding motility auxiliary subunit
MLYFPGAVQKSDATGGDAQFVPLLHTTREGNTFELDRSLLMMPGGPDPQAINRAFQPGVQPVTLAARLTGTFRSAFPDGAPKTDEATEDGEEPGVDDEATGDQDTTGDEAEPEGPQPETDQAEAPEASTHLAESREPTTIVVCADVDMLADGLAYQRVLGGFLYPVSANGDFLTNSVDFLAGSTDLMSVRSRGNFERRFTVVSEIEREADRATQEQVQRINEEIERFETEIRELSSQYNERTAGLVKGEALDRRRELEREVREKRRELNRVQKERTDRIEALGTRLKVINTVVIPALVLLAGIGVWWFRHRSRRTVKGGVA